ncbi:hypothetical protein FN846DRAFT_912817 [Sphaerosporella brunnea]|uniref:Uncharacterized protein n=1 Tax=Sphaerosporella brunnea TaxID=1250544 RepID=A0A5J5EFR4_9PEZI|nr:hypothetical protein FN846DRAFT_912817 [Sphaerosporella brunnea]
MSASQVLDPRLQNLGAVPKAISLMDLSLAAEPSSSSSGLQPAAEGAAEGIAKNTAEGTAEPSAVTFRRVASNVPPPILDYSSKALYVESLAGHYDVLTFRLPHERLLTPVFNFPTRCHIR